MSRGVKLKIYFRFWIQQINFLLEGEGCGLSALPVKLTTPTLHIGCHSYHLTSRWKSSLIHNPSSQIPKVFNHNKKEVLFFH